ncbi:MAG: hypothetical protein AB1505_22540 [Candidatus Latescibacterota bacterium]
MSLLALCSCLRVPPQRAYQIRLAPDPGLLDGATYYASPEDSTTVFEQQGFRLKVRYLSDAELNQEYAKDTFREPNLNPFTYGRDRDLDRGYTPPRFTVFRLTVVNQAYPKVLVDPAQMVLRTDRGDQLAYWDVRQRDAPNSLERYWMERSGEGGNEEYYFSQRLGLVREALYRRHTFVFQGESYTGKVVFAALHPDVRQATLEVEGIVLRVDAFDRPTETTRAGFRFDVQQAVVAAAACVRKASPERLL